MPEIKQYSKAWLKQLVIEAEQASWIDTELTCKKLLTELKNYVQHLDFVDSNRGKGTSAKRVAASRENGKKGGWKKGVSRKKTEQTENP